MAFMKDEEKKLLLDRYPDIEWPDDVTELRCVRCQLVSISHYVSNCHHLFCNNCRRVLSDGGQWKCPQCQQYVTQLDDQDLDVEFKINKMTVPCPNKKYGCKYEDQLRKIPSHLNKCVDTREAALPVEYTGTNRIEAVVNQLIKVNAIIGELTEGMREMKDKFSQLERKSGEMDSKFDDSIVRMSQDMKTQQEKFEEQERHLAEVNTAQHALTERLTAVQTPAIDSNSATKTNAEEFQSLKAQLEAINLRIHQNESTLQQTTSTVEEMRMKMVSMTQQQETRQNKIQLRSAELNPLKEETYEWILNDVEKTTSKAHWRFESEVFRFVGYKYDIQAQLEKKKSGIYIHLQFKDGDEINQFQNKHGFTGLKYVIKSQSNIPQDKSMIRKAFLRFDECFGRYRWILGYWLPDTILSPPYMENDCIKISMLFEPPSIDHSFVSNNGVLMWTVDNYTTRKQEEMYSYIWSPSFYTSRRGYRVRIQLAINYEQSMFIKVYFLTGELDDSLSIDFQHKTTVTLFNQLDPSKNLVKSEQRDNIVIYNIQLQNSKLVEDNGFIKDDSLLLKVVIEPVITKLSTK